MDIKANQCPAGKEFGKSHNKFRECRECPDEVFHPCIIAQDALEAQSKAMDNKTGMDSKERAERHRKRKRQEALKDRKEAKERAEKKQVEDRTEKERIRVEQIEAERVGKKKHKPHAFTKDFHRLRVYKRRKQSYVVSAIIDYIQGKTIALSFGKRKGSPMWYEFGTYSSLEKELGWPEDKAHPVLKMIEDDGIIIYRGPKHKRAVAFNPEVFDITKAQMEADGIDIDRMEPGTHWRIKITKTETLVWDLRKGKPKKARKKRVEKPRRKRHEDPDNPSRKVLRNQPDGTTKAVWL